MSGQSIVQVDAFSDRPFAGNPAAVCVIAGPPENTDESWMQAVALEMNLSETAFVWPLAGAGNLFRLRWFTPAQEIALCGHATLGSAFVLWQDGHLPADKTARFETMSGELTARRFVDDGGVWIELDFPATRVEESPAPAGLLEALGANARFVGRSKFDYLVEVESESSVRALAPNLAALAEVEARGVIVTSAADPETRHDIVSRFFAPSAGVPEDPVTGSAHCALGPYWQDKLGTDVLSACQASPRGGTLRLRMTGSRVLLRGQAVTTLRGSLMV